MHRYAADDAQAMNFGWVEQGLLAGCRGPQSNQDLDFLASQGIRVLVRLAYARETGMAAQRVQEHGMVDVYDPVQDCTALSQPQIDRLVKAVRTAVAGGQPVAVSCLMGHGRTGTLLACCLAAQGLPADEAIKRLIAIRPGSMEILRVTEQRDAVREYARRLAAGEVVVRAAT